VIAINQQNKKEYQVFVADNLIKPYFPEALMYVLCSSKVFVIDKQIKKIKDECLSYMAFEIEGKLYTGFFSSEYEWFKNNIKTTVPTLFDFVQEINS